MGRIPHSSPDEFIKALDFPVWDTHFHNNDGSSDQHEPVRCGTLDIPLVVSAFAEIGPMFRQYPLHILPRHPLARILKFPQR